MSDCCDNGGCCENVTGDLASMKKLFSELVENYPMAVAGNKKRMVASRKLLMEIKKLSLAMRKNVLEECKKARETGAQ